MSRDAKVGMVIVFAFVFLLGTILVHRFHLTDLGQRAGGNETESANPDGSAPFVNSANDDTPSGSSDSGAVTTVNAFPAENLNSQPAGGRKSEPFDSSFSRSQRLTGQPSSPLPRVDVTEASDSGAHISLTDPSDDHPSAAIVESHRSSKNSDENETITEQSSKTEMPGTRTDSHHRSPPLLEISSGSPGIRRPVRDVPDTESEVASTAGDVTSVDSNESASGLPTEDTETTQSDQESMAGTQPGRRMPPLHRPPSLEPDDDAEELATGATSIQQAADKRRQGPEDTSPPRLPKYGGSSQAIIESVPDHDSRAMPRGTDRSTDAAEPLSPSNRTPTRMSSQSDDTQIAGQRTYVVKDGDSFWSISAKQYGTGKYFRALEEYNKDRLSTSGGGGKVLRPGTAIALPDESLLQSSSARKKVAELAASKATKYDPGKEDSSAVNATKRDSGLGSRRETASPPGTYRVKEGDTLSTIALRELGTSKRWQEIFQLNRDKLSDELSLKVGMELKMPPASTAEKAAGRPNF